MNSRFAKVQRPVGLGALKTAVLRQRKLIAVQADKRGGAPTETPPSTANQPAPTVDVANPAVFASGLAGLTAVSTDVFNDSLSLHVLPDLAIHNWVTAHLPLATRLFIDFGPISNSVNYLGVLGWVIAAGVLLSGPSKAIAARMIPLCSAMYGFGGGAIANSDPWLVHNVKEFFHRGRPSDAHHTFSYVSGHTTAATMTLGIFLFVLLPLVLERDSQDGQESSLERVQHLLLPVWVGGAAFTAAARVFGDAHWLSDTLGGFSLGVALTSLTAMVALRLNASATEEAQ